MNDRNFNTLAIGDDVVVYPKDFIASVIDVKQDSDDEWYAIVEDENGDTFTVDSDNIELA
jgi:hypothetical protein